MGREGGVGVLGQNIQKQRTDREAEAKNGRERRDRGLKKSE